MSARAAVWALAAAVTLGPVGYLGAHVRRSTVRFERPLVALGGGHGRPALYVGRRRVDGHAEYRAVVRMHHGRFVMADLPATRVRVVTSAGPARIVYGRSCSGVASGAATSHPGFGLRAWNRRCMPRWFSVTLFLPKGAVRDGWTPGFDRPALVYSGD